MGGGVDVIYGVIPSALLEEYRKWYNINRYNLGIRDVPVNIYFSKNITDLTLHKDYYLLKKLRWVGYFI